MSLAAQRTASRDVPLRSSTIRQVDAMRVLLVEDEAASAQG